jgi:hypothetical protein
MSHPLNYSTLFSALLITVTPLFAADPPNVVIIYADDKYQQRTPDDYMPQETGRMNRTHHNR